MHRIQTRTGQGVAIRTVRLNSPESASLLVTPRQVLLVASRPAWVYAIPNGQPGGKIGGLLAGVDTVTAGPPGRLWLTRIVKGRSVTTLTDFDGRRRQVDGIPFQFRGYDDVRSDGAGGLLVSGPGGWYQLTADGPRRVTAGNVLATGPRLYLATECDARLWCSRYLISRTGHWRRVSAAPINDYGTGTISADGRYAATYSAAPRPAERMTYDV